MTPDAAAERPAPAPWLAAAAFALLQLLIVAAHSRLAAPLGIEELGFVQLPPLAVWLSCSAAWVWAAIAWWRAEPQAGRAVWVFASSVGLLGACLAVQALQRRPPLLVPLVLFAVAAGLGDALLCRRAVARAPQWALRLTAWGALGLVFAQAPRWFPYPSGVLLVFLFVLLLDAPRRSRALARPVLAVVAVLLLLFVLDAALSLGGSHQERVRENFYRHDPLLGYRNEPGEARERVTHDGELVYDITHTIDEYGRREVPASIANVGSRHLLVFGCSFVFGAAVEDDQTLPAQLARRLSGYRVYNYGVNGYGTHQVYAKIDSGELPREVPERTGALIYMLLFPQHNDRLLGTYWPISWLADSPHYALRDGELVCLGSFRESDALRLRLDDAIRSSPTLNMVAMRLHNRASPRRDISLFLELVVQSRRRYLEQFPGSRFYVGVWPQNTEVADRAVQALIDRGIRVFDLRPALGERFRAAPEKYTVVGEGHPSPLAHAQTAEELTRMFLEAER